MESTVDHIQLKRAWQTAFEQRTCPDGATLFADPPDEQLQRHLRMCHVCRENREIPADQRDAWGELLRRFGAAGQKPALPAQTVAGQVWSLQRSLAGWGKDGYFYQPPRVLLLEKIEDAKGFRAVQLSSDRYLMAEGDVWLDDRFGFAEGWNCYSVHEKALAGCWGAVADGVLVQVREAAELKHAPVVEDSILYFFRRLEISVGARVALPSVAVLVEEWEQGEQEFRELFPGLAVILNQARDFSLRISASAMAILQATFAPRPVLVTRSAAIGRPPQSGIVLPEEARALLVAKFPVIPVEMGYFPDGYRISFRIIGPIPNTPPALSVTIDDLKSQKLQWSQWGGNAPYICLGDVSGRIAVIEVDTAIITIELVC